MKNDSIKLWAKVWALCLVCVIALSGCGNKVKDASYWDDLGSPEFWRRINTVDAHNEQDTIIGNFTENGQDSLLLFVTRLRKKQMDAFIYNQTTREYLDSTLLESITPLPNLWIKATDLDGNGTCEFGYLPTWNNRQWRTYRIFTLVNYQWRYLVNGEYLDTPEWFRHTGVEIAEKGPHKGQVLIHYAYEGPNES